MRLDLATAFLLVAAATLSVGPPLSAQVTDVGGCEDACCLEDAEVDGECCDGESCPLWTVTADALILQRRDSSEPVLIFNTAAPAQHLNASDFHSPSQGGVDLSLARHFAGDNRLEVRYFGLDDCNATADVATTAGDLLQVNAALPVLTTAGTAIRASRSADLQNVEVNALHRIGERCGVLAGFRFAELDEHLAFDLVDATIPFTYDTRTRNRLWGGQIGADLVLWDRGGPVTIEGVGKAGIYADAAAHDSVYATGVFAPTAGGRTTSTAFIGELGVTGACRLTEQLSFRGGYRLLWIDGVALATDQVAVSDFLTHTGIDTSGDAFYHGAFVGLQYVR
jgi:hypothetical protein